MYTIKQILYRRFLIIVILLAVVSLVFEAFQLNYVVNDFVRSSRKSNKILAQAFEPFVEKSTDVDFKSIVSVLDFENDYQLIELTNLKGKILAIKGEWPSVDENEIVKGLTYEYFKERLNLYFNKKKIGEILILRKTDKLKDKVFNNLAYFFFALLGITFTLFLLGRKLSLEVSNSLGEMRDRFSKARELSFYENYNQSDQNYFSEEIKDLSQSFSDLIFDLKTSKNSLEELNAELEERIRLKTQDLRHSIADLKKYQRKLVAQEKLVSLGTLSAGVAHEIKNPLNLIANSAKLIENVIVEFDKVDEELRNSNLSQSSLESIDLGLSDLKVTTRIIRDNSERADSIIRSMLQQTRAKASELEFVNYTEMLTKISSLCYHSARAKDKSFDVQIIRDIPEQLALHCYPVDLERALINIFDNAFYAIRHKKKNLREEKYSPELVIRAVKSDDYFEVMISDNGVGISKDLRDKIFEPFFTTKPSTEGTGLGMSMIYDIAMSHDGDLLVDSIEGEGTKITLKISSKLGREN